MSISEIHTTTLGQALTELENLAAEDDVGFRGHSNVEWRLCSTLSRFTTVTSENWHMLNDELLKHFMSGLASVGQLPSTMKDRRGRLEFARHYGVPSPLIDLSLSPYVAIFFAFNGIRRDYQNAAAEVVVYAVRFRGLAHAWAQLCAHGDSVLFAQHYDRFLYERNPLFVRAYPKYTLKLIRFPASWNTKMQRQMGMFLYDSLDYAMLKKRDLEEFISDVKESALGPGSTKTSSTLTKVYIPKSIVRDVFVRLELMGMTGARLLDGHEGAAADVYNSSNYNRKTGYAWDLEVDPPDDTEL
jgi:FRG domain